MVVPPGGTTASAKLWLAAFADGTPASSRIDEPGIEVENGIERAARADPGVDGRPDLFAAAPRCVAHREDRRAYDPRVACVHPIDDQLHCIDDLSRRRRRSVGAAADVVGA